MDNPSNRFRSKEFLELQAKWYKKLEKTGFVDCEQDEDHLKLWSSHYFQSKHPVPENAKEEYYRIAGHFLYDHEFQSKTERLIWELHCNGIGVREIATTLKKRRIKVFNKTNKDNVWAVIRRLSTEMIAQWKK